MTTQTLYARRLLAPWLLALAACIGLSAVGCSDDGLPPVRQDDADDRAWIRQVVPVLYGRKVRNFNELEFLNDMVAEVGRRKSLEAMMGAYEFTEHWSDVLADMMRLDRRGDCKKGDAFTGLLYPSLGAVTPALASFIRDMGPMTDFGADFDLRDVVLSAIVADDLLPAYRANLYVLQSNASACNTNTNDLGDRFAFEYIHRERDCLSCHRANTSVTDGQAWDRHWPLPGNFDAAMWNGQLNGLGASTGNYAAFRKGQAQSGGPDPTHERPWLRMKGVGVFETPSDAAHAAGTFGRTPLDGTVVGAKPTIHFVARRLRDGAEDIAADGVERTVAPGAQSLCEICAFCANPSPMPQGNGPDLAEWVNMTATCGMFANAPGGNGAVHAAEIRTWAVGQPGVNDGKCEGCHAPGGQTPTISDDANWWVEVAKPPFSDINDPASSTLVCRVSGVGCGDQMPIGGPFLGAVGLQKLQDWMADLQVDPCPTAQCNNPPADFIDDHEAFAYLTGARVVEQIWDHVMGAPLTAPHYFSRNEEQFEILHTLTEEIFLPSNWSLRDVLTHILVSDYFNRRPPAEQIVSFFGAYELPPVFDPWWVADPRDVTATPTLETEQNAMTETLTRYRPTTLVRSVGAALGWPDHVAFPDDTSYPRLSFYGNIGQFIGPAEPGFNGFDLASMLIWEKTADCQKLGPSDDWIDLLVSAAEADAASLTVEDVFVALRDRLLGDGALAATEAAAFVSVLGVQSEADAIRAIADDYLSSINLSDPLSQLTSGEWPSLNQAVRAVCGVMVKSPQFMIRGLKPRGAGPEPAPQVCLPFEPCSYNEVCFSYQHLFDQVTKPLRVHCDPSGVQVFSMGPGGEEPIYLNGVYSGNADTICPPGQCGFVGVSRSPDAACVDDPTACGFTVEPPICDPRCGDPTTCCGDPAPAFPRMGLHTIWAVGATVTIADDVRISRQGLTPFVAVPADHALEYGDVLEVPAEGRLHITEPPDLLAAAQAGGGEEEVLPFTYDPPPYDMTGVGPRYLIVTDAKALDRIDALQEEMARAKAWSRQNAAVTHAVIKLDESRRYGILGGEPPVDHVSFQPEDHDQ